MSLIQCRVAVCDDEPIYINQIREFLAVLGEKKSIDYTVLSFSTAQELLDAPFNYNILLLDIRLNAGNDGIEIGKILRKRGNQAVFILISSLQDRYKDGYCVTTYRFLEKPFKRTEFEDAMTGAVSTVTHDTQRLAVRYKASERYIDIKDIIYLESYYRNCFVVATEEKLTTKESLDDLQLRLPPSIFYRAQKSFIINLGHVIQTSRAYVVMADKRKITLTRGNFEALDAALTQFLKEQNR